MDGTFGVGVEAVVAQAEIHALFVAVINRRGILIRLCDFCPAVIRQLPGLLLLTGNISQHFVGIRHSGKCRFHKDNRYIQSVHILFYRLFRLSDINDDIRCFRNQGFHIKTCIFSVELPEFRKAPVLFVNILLRLIGEISGQTGQLIRAHRVKNNLCQWTGGRDLRDLRRDLHLSSG